VSRRELVGEDPPDKLSFVVTVVGVFSGDEQPLQMHLLGEAGMGFCVLESQASDGAKRSIGTP
jgi:hypothetical protein